MNGPDRRRESSEERVWSAGAEGDDGTVRPITRRSFVRTSAVAASALALGAASATAQSVQEESCQEGDVIEVGGGDWHLLNNKWGMPDSDQCIWLNDDGSYGYDFTAVGDGINYPESFCGGRPWGSDSGIPELPGRRGDIDEFVLEWDVDISISGGAWNLAEEWWLLDGQPDPSNPPIEYEIMLVLDWGGGHGHYMEQENVRTDQFGNQIDHWADYDHSEGWKFHIFRISQASSSGQVDLTEIMDYLSEEYGVSDDLTLTGVEVGNEYWEGSQGEVTFNTLDLTVNGTTYESGADGGGGGGDDDGDNGGDDGNDGDDGGNGGGDDDLIAEANPSTTQASVGQNVSFQVEDTSGDSNWITALEWDFDDGTTDSGWWVQHSWDAPGTYAVALTATDNEGNSTTHVVEIDVS